jgi:Tol biopolymer transport system component
MSFRRALLILILVSIPSSVTFGHNTEFGVLKGPYLGQTPPRIEAELFAPDLLSAGGTELSIAFSPDGEEFSYSLKTHGERYGIETRGAFSRWFMMHSEMKNGQWSEPREYSFNPDRVEGYPFFSPDGKRLYFFSFRENRNRSKNSSLPIWYVEKENAEWSNPRQIEFEGDFEARRGPSYVTASANGNLYFGIFVEGSGYIYMSEHRNGKYLRPERVSDAINDHGGNHPYIAPDESYMIFDDVRSENSYGETDLFVSFRDKNGEWIPAENLGERVNTEYDERRPFVSFDGKYLFFASDKIKAILPNDPMTLGELRHLTDVPANGEWRIYWIDAAVIEDMRPKDLK